MNGWHSSTDEMKSSSACGGDGPSAVGAQLPDRGIHGPLWIDAVSAVLYFALSPQFASSTAGLRTDLLLSGAISGSLLVRSRCPRAVIMTVLALTLVKIALSASTEPMIGIGRAMATYVATRPSRSGKTLVAFLTVACMLLALVIGGPRTWRLGSGPWVLLSSLSVIAGIAIGVNSAMVREAAAQRARVRADEKARSERLRIARDLHDVTSRTLVSIGVQAGSSTRWRATQRHPTRFAPAWCLHSPREKQS